jgi:hypothetical protein
VMRLMACQCAVQRSRGLEQTTDSHVQTAEVSITVCCAGGRWRHG